MIQMQFMREEKKFISEVSSMVLTKTKGAAEVNLRNKVNDAAVTVPTCLNDSQRQGTESRIINEPAASKLDNKGGDEHNEVVYEMGGDTFDDSILPNKVDIFEVKVINIDHIRNSMTFFFSQIDPSFSLFLFVVDIFLKAPDEGVRGPYMRGKTYIFIKTWNKTFALKFQLQKCLPKRSWTRSRRQREYQKSSSALYIKASNLRHHKHTQPKDHPRKRYC